MAAADTQQAQTRAMSSAEASVQEWLDAVHRGAGRLSNMMEELGLPLSVTAEASDHKAFRDQMYDEMIREMEERHI